MSQQQHMPHLGMVGLGRMGAGLVHPVVGGHRCNTAIRPAPRAGTERSGARGAHLAHVVLVPEQEVLAEHAVAEASRKEAEVDEADFPRAPLHRFRAPVDAGGGWRPGGARWRCGCS